MGRNAVLSPCRTWRYLLTRQVGAELGHGVVNFILLNPSTADEDIDDQTIRRCKGFAHAWGYRSLVVTNLFGIRATDPAVMKVTADPVGPDNDTTIREIAANANAVVIAWGVHGSHRGRDQQVLEMLAAIGVAPLCLGMTRGGFPKHPCRLPAGLAPVVFEQRAAVAS